MDSVTPLGFLNADPRPTCVVDLRKSEKGGALYIELSNKALQEQSHLLHVLQTYDKDEEDDGAKTTLRAWVTNDGQDVAASGSFEWIHGYHLFGYTIDKRWRVIQWPQTDHGVINTTCEIGASHADEDASLASAMNELTFSEQDLKDALAEGNYVTEKLASILAMIEMIDVGIFEYDMNSVLINANNAFYKLSGHPRESAKEEYSWADCVFDEDRDEIYGHWDMLTQGIATTFEMRWKRPAISMLNGEEDRKGQWVLAACVPMRDEDGHITSVSGCITDIAAQKRSESDALKKAEALERAQASQKRFSRFAECANVGIWICNLDQEMQYCNREWFAVTGHPVVDFQDVVWPNCLTEESLGSVANHWDTLVNTKEAVNFPLQLRRAWNNGEGGQGQAWVMASAYPELNEDGEVVAVAGTLSDISHLKWAESVQKRRTDEAIEAKRQQENFIDITSHEIRNPLGAVMHCADLIQSSLTDMAHLSGTNISCLPLDQRSHYNELRDGSVEAVNTILSCSMHMKRMIDDILTLSKLDSRLLTITPSPVRLDHVLKDTTTMFDVDARKVGVTMRAVKEQSLETYAVDWVMLDAGRLMQVLINLITNALKFTEKEAVRLVTISMGASRSRPCERDLDVDFIPVSTLRERAQFGPEWGSGEDIYAYFKVTDSGCGFSSEQRNTIFERFAQASPRTHSKYGGSGLGLFITRELIEMQGGEIGVSSRLGDGAAFAFYIAARRVSAQETDSGAANLRSPAQVGSNPARVRYTILVVEDNLVNQKVLRKQLEKLGHEVHVVSHGGEALAFLETTSSWAGNPSSPIYLSVVLMDIEMPVMDGITCTRRIREAQARGAIEGHLPIIAVSANARDEQVHHAIESGMDDAISKPFRVVDLIPKIERLATVWVADAG